MEMQKVTTKHRTAKYYGPSTSTAPADLNLIHTWRNEPLRTIEADMEEQGFGMSEDLYDLVEQDGIWCVSGWKNDNDVEPHGWVEFNYDPMFEEGEEETVCGWCDEPCGSNHFPIITEDGSFPHCSEECRECHQDNIKDGE